MDMWDPYIEAVRGQAPHVKIVFDCFHGVHAFNRVIDKVRVSERKRAEKSQQDVYQGVRYLLLANKRKTRNKDAQAHFLRNTPFGPIPASGSKCNPRNIQYIDPVPFFALLEREQK